MRRLPLSPRTLYHQNIKVVKKMIIIYQHFFFIYLFLGCPEAIDPTRAQTLT